MKLAEQVLSLLEKKEVMTPDDFKVFLTKVLDSGLKVKGDGQIIPKNADGILKVMIKFDDNEYKIADVIKVKYMDSSQVSLDFDREGAKLLKKFS